MAEPRTIRRARNLRQLSGTAERAVWKLLRDHRLAGHKFRRQHPIEPFVVDFACVAAKLIVEIDDLSHTLPEQIAFDAQRTAFLEAQGWRVLRIKDGPALSDASAVIALVLQALEQPPQPALSPKSGGEGS